MASIINALESAIRVEDVLAHAEKYLAHLPRTENGESFPEKVESLSEHMDLVLGNARKICEAQQLDGIITGLIWQVAKGLEMENSEKVVPVIIQLFADALVFHDFGKVNPYFQTKRMQNNDPLFKGKHPKFFSPEHGHSDLGAYLFTVFHLEKMKTYDLPNNEKMRLSALVLAFSNSILLHHSPRLFQPSANVKRSQFFEKRKELEVFIKFYRSFPAPTLAIPLLENIEHIFPKIESGPAAFPLFALLRLNFSLLTAADYIATGEYSYGLKLETKTDWGVMDKGLQNHIIEKARTSKGYNEDAHRKAADEDFVFQNPGKANGANLNILRTEMAVKMLRQIRANSDQRLFYLEAPTGGGKTNLSMLAVAELLKANRELNKVFYVFPFTTLITQTHQNIRETLKLDDEQIGLMHSKVGFQANQNGETKESLNDGLYGNQRKDFLSNLFALYQVCLMTHIRFFDVLKSNRKDSIYLMHRLANSIVILDELQSYDPKHWDKMMYHLEQYGRHFNIRFILMSATLPRLDKIESVRKTTAIKEGSVVDLLPNPHEYFKNENFSGRVSFNFELLNREGNIEEEELADIVLQKSKERAGKHGGRVFTIIEFIFKKSATAFKKEVLNREKNEGKFFDEIFVLSGTILESRRRHIINFLKRNQKAEGLKVLLITTQVVEAGVDIDMDLGFKNVSLIDSDEQLAGRVNRNVDKVDCEVYLFRLNDASVIYDKDIRYQMVNNRDDISPTFHQEVLESKDFGRLYDLVFQKLERINGSPLMQNYHDYIDYFKTIDFPEIHANFKLIDQKNLSVFVPLKLDMQIENEKGEMEDFFSPFEQDFLKKGGIWKNGEKVVDGERVWELFMDLMKNPNEDFIAKKVERKAIQGILAKFTFSMFDSEKVRSNFQPYINPEISFDEYLYLHRYDQVYKPVSGLDESKFGAAENQII